MCRASFSTGAARISPPRCSSSSTRRRRASTRATSSTFTSACPGPIPIAVSPRGWSSSLYSEADSPLRYRINRLGGRSQQDKWILQAELFNELHRWVRADWKKIKLATNSYREAEKYYEVVRDFLKAAQRVWGDTWAQRELHGHASPVTLKALMRVCADLARDDAIQPTAGQALGRPAKRLEQSALSVQSRRFLRALPRQGRSRARRAHPSRPGQGRRHRSQNRRKKLVARSDYYPTAAGAGRRS